MSDDARRTGLLRWVTLAVAIAALLALIIGVGLANPVRSTAVQTDRLGPEAGESVANYLARAKQSLVTADVDRHYALVSFDRELDPAAAARTAGDLRISEALFHLPLDRVQTPVFTVQTGGSADAVTVLTTASAQAAAEADDADVDTGRQSRIAADSARTFRSGGEGIAGLVLWGSAPQLRALASAPNVRAVEALPADAVFGHFAVTPLLPAQTTRVVPGPDDGEVP